MKYSFFVKPLLLVFTLFIGFYGCGGDKQPEQASKSAFSLSGNQNTPKADSELILKHIEKQLENGSRVVGSKAHQLTKEYFLATLKDNADMIQTQDFELLGYDNEKLQLTNIIAKFNPAAAKRIFICAHWDSRPRSDQETDPKLMKLPVLGANDGASGCAILLELARVLKKQKPGYGVDLIFFDGEDYGKNSNLSMFCLGSKYFAANKKDYAPEFGILLDMVGDKEARFAIEENSATYGEDVTSIVWEAARKLGAGTFVSEKGSAIYDDHIPLNQAGIKTIDIIDASLVGADILMGRRHYWHTTKDTIDNLSKETLQQVADVLLNVIYTLNFN